MPATNEHPLARVGIVGGGQLGRMLALAAQQMGIAVRVLDPDPHCPAAQVCDEHLQGGLHDTDKIIALADGCDALTFEIEDIDVKALFKLRDSGVRVFPSPESLAVIQDKLTQKQALADAGIPTAEFTGISTLDDKQAESFGYPLVQKARRGGYDGRGVAVMHSLADLQQALPVASYIERFITAKKELAVVIARSEQGETASYPVVEMGFRAGENVLDLLLAPAQISDDIAKRAVALAEKTVAALAGVGVFGVELFLDEDDSLWVNEVAPRVHNSGHHTIEACYTSQFEQHLRAVLGWPLGSTHQHSYSAMLNLLGASDADGVPSVQGLETALGLPGVAVHLYGKQSVRAYRKMGHVTVLADALDSARDIAWQLRGQLIITSENSNA